jgi:hypothetical protein
LPLHARLGIQTAQLWTQALTSLRARQTLAGLLDTINRFEAETLQKAGLQSSAPAPTSIAPLPGQPG